MTGFASVSRQRDSLDQWESIAGDGLSGRLFLGRRNLALFLQSRLDELAGVLVSKGQVPRFLDQTTFD